VVGGDGRAWLVDFDRAEAGADRRRLDRDTAGLLAALSLTAEPALVATAAREALGPETVDRAVALLGSRDLPAATRRRLRARPEVRERLGA